jgi:hypothetical protein
MNKFALAIFLLFSCNGFLRAQQAQKCFTPLAKPESTNSADWKKDFIDFNPTVKPEGVVQVYKITDGVGDKINLDFYSVTFHKPSDSNMTIERVFREVRQHFPRFVADNPGREGGPSGSNFKPYGATSDPNDRLFKNNLKLWLSDNPTGALMSFTFKSYTVGALSGRALMIVAEQGDVAVECASKTDFIFATVYTENHTEHPVSGYRGFGIKENPGTDTWTIYAMAADRETKSPSGRQYIGNFLLKNHLAPGIEGGEDAIYREGHKFWLVFFPNLVDYLEDEGMKFVRESFITNSCRYAYSSTSGASPSPMFCSTSEPNPRPGPRPGPPLPPGPTPGSTPNPRPGPTPRPSP